MYETAIAGDYDIVDTAFYKEETDQNILCTGDDCTGMLDDEKRSKLIFGAGGYVWSKIFRAGLFEGADPVFREGCILEDLDFALYMLSVAKSIGTVKEVLYVYKYYKKSISHNTEQQFYYKNATDAIKAIYDRLYKLPDYEGIREAVEAIIYKLYSCTLNQCIAECCNRRIVAGNDMIDSLVKLKDHTTSGDYLNNRYIHDELGDADINIMLKIDEVYQ